MNTEMEYYLKTELNHLKTLRNDNHKKLIGLESYRDKVLLPSKKGSNDYYYVNVPGKEEGTLKRRYLGGRRNDEVLRIQEAKSLEKGLEVIEKNIELLTALLNGYSDFDREAISKLLPKTYRSFTNTDSSLKTDYPERATKWLKENMSLKEDFLMRYPEIHPESFKVERADGMWFRSRAEAMIASEFDNCGIPYVYELPHYCNGKWIKSDFTALSTKDYTTEIILEHLGLMNDEHYRHNVSDKIADYMAAGYRPNINLFFTFDNPDQSFSLIPLRNIIETWLIP